MGAQYRSGRSSTPPRMSANPGSAPDNNFLYDKWDEDSPEKKSDCKGDTKRPHVSESKGGRGVYSGDVKADANWLEENFDDND